MTSLVERSSALVVTARDALRRVDADVRTGSGLAPVWLTGFGVLDTQLDGGLHAGDLALLAGAQGTGKTTMALQIARNVAASGGTAVFVCYEHTPQQLVERLLVMECGLLAGPAAPSQEELRRCLAAGNGGLGPALAHLPGASEALARLDGYGEHLHLVGARGDTTGIEDIRALASSVSDAPVLVVDYLQKVAAGDDGDEDVRVARVGTALKDLALELAIPVLAIAAVDRVGLDSRRIRARHLKGSVALAYEADAILVLQNKYDIVSRNNLVFGTGAEEHQRWLVCSLEKNRHGDDRTALEFRKRLAHGYLEPQGRVVEEQLVDERLHLDES